jgi:large subunit ribosomal protein L22
VPGPKTNEREGTRAVLKDARFSAYKAREVLDLVRGLDVARARDVLHFCERDAALDVAKILDSAIANAHHNDQLDPEELFVSACFADEGRTLKRGRPRARGRYTRIRKRTCHITIIVSRLPEDRLGRLRAKQTADQADRRARRVAGGRRSETSPAEGNRRSRRTRGGAAAEATAPEETVTDETVTQDTVTEDTATEETVTDEAVTDETVADVVDAPGDAAEQAGIVDQQAEAVQALDEAPSDENASEEDK